jgi:hypothetical protein
MTRPENSLPDVFRLLTYTWKIWALVTFCELPEALAREALRPAR